MRVIRDFAQDGKTPRLLIMLPGALQRPEDFIQAGFVQAVRKRKLPLDLALVDLALEYVGDTTEPATLQRLHEQVIKPARNAGYQEIWLGGISIGGLLAVACAERFAGQLDGLCLLAPYPGNRILTNEIEAAGGLEHWHAAPDTDDAEPSMWRWLKTRRAQPRVYVGYGLQDRFAPALRTLAAAPAVHEFDTIAGGHDWPTWSVLWDRFLARTFAAEGAPA